MNKLFKYKQKLYIKRYIKNLSRLEILVAELNNQSIPLIKKTKLNNYINNILVENYYLINSIQICYA